MRRWPNAVNAVVIEASINGEQYKVVIRLDPTLRRRVERMLIKGYSEGL